MQLNIKLTFNIIILFLFAVISHNAFSTSHFKQSGKIFSNYMVIDDVQLNRVRQVVQDDSGFLWLISDEHGLLRFDGSHIDKIKLNVAEQRSLTLERSSSKNVNVKEETKITNIEQLIISSEQNLWLRSSSNQLLRYNPSKQTTHQFALDNNQPNLTIKGMAKRSNGELWLATTHQLWRWQNNEQRWLSVTELYSFEDYDKFSIKNLFFDGEDNLWLTTLKSGVVKITTAGKITRYSAEFGSLHSNGIMSFIEATDGSIFLGTTAGLERLASDHSQFELISISQQESSTSNSDENKSYAQLVTSLVQLRDDIWVGSYTKGLLKFDISSQKLTTVSSKKQFSLNSQEINGLFVDKDQNLWLATETGLSFLRQQFQSADIWQAENTNCNPIGFGQFQNDSLFVCGNVIFRQTQDNQITIEKTLPFKVLSAKLQEGIFWLGTVANGLFQYQLSNQQLKPLSRSDILLTDKSIYSLELNAGNVWAATFDFSGTENRYLLHLDLDGKLLEKFITPLNVTNILTIDSTHLLLTGFMHTEGPIIFNTDNGTYSELTLGVGQIYSALKQGESIWLGTSTLGLIEVEFKRGVIEPNSIVNIVPTATAAFDLTSDNNGGAYYQYNNDIYHYSKQTLTNRCLTCPLERGILNSLYLGDIGIFSKQLFVGGKDLLFKANLNDLKTQSALHQVYVRNLKVLNKNIKASDDNSPVNLEVAINDLQQIEIPYNLPMFSFEFSTVSSPTRGDFQYYYQFTNTGKQWIAADKRNPTATFTNLVDGDYKLTIKSVDQTSKKVSSKSISIKVPTPWWKGSLFISLCGLTLITIIWGLFHLRTYQLQARNQELSEAIKRQTKSLREQNAAINLKQQKIEALLSEKLRLFTRITHELKTPLTLIRSPIERLIKKSNDQQDIRLLQLVSKNTKKLQRLIEQFVNISKVETTKHLERKPYDISSIIKSIVSSFEYAFLEKNLSLKLSLAEGAIVDLVEDSFEMIFINVLSNAVKYTQPGGEIYIHVECKDTVIIIIEDSGIGIDKGNLEKVFTPFFRIHSATNQHVEGSGIGLTVVKELVDINEGRITIQSKTKIGTRVELEFWKSNEMPADGLATHRTAPFIVKDTEMIALSKDSKSLPPEQKRFGLNVESESFEQKPLLLIIEDNGDMRNYLFESLNNDFLCITAKDGETGVKLAREKIPDIILCDLMMPGISGYEVCNQLRTSDWTAHIPLLILTANEEHKVRTEGWNNLIDGFMSKPFSEEELITQLKNLYSIRKLLTRKNSMSLASKNQAIKFEDNKDDYFLENFKMLVGENLSREDFDRKKAASMLAVSERQLQRKLSALADITFSEYLRVARLNRAKSHLKSGDRISDVADKVGFSSLSYFGACFKAETGLTPKQFQQMQIEKV
ncbi:hybrid sensor histidine kinase/response regulator transcription factor [Thalassotalea ganghwensis]